MKRIHHKIGRGAVYIGRMAVLLALLLCVGLLAACGEGPDISGGTSTGEVSDPAVPEYEGSGLMIHAVHGTGEKGAEAVADHGFVSLYNATEAPIKLGGMALYYKTIEDGTYTVFSFPRDSEIPARGYYLVRAASPESLNEDNLIMKISGFDAEWDVLIDNKEVCLLLAPEGLAPDPQADVTSLDGVLSVFYASSAAPIRSVYAVDDLTRNKIAVRTAATDYSGYHLVNLTRAATAELASLCPVNSKGEACEVVGSRLSEVSFSHPAGVYTEAFDLTLAAPDGYTVYYTTDGSDPADAGNGARKTYAGAIEMTDTSAMRWGPLTRGWRYLPAANRQIGAHVIKACATNGRESTAVFTNTYFVTDALAAYGVTVMSISLPAEEILDDGFYEGYCPSGILTDPRPRGVGILEVFDQDGARVGNSRVEMAISGNGSSIWGQKSIRIYYKSKNNQDAGLQSDLNYDLFGGLARDDQGEAITSFSRIQLRNSGNDCGHSYFRDAYMQRACQDLRLDTMASAPVLVFLNGEFWGMYNARERYSPEYVASHYGVNKDNVTILESDYEALVYGENPNAPYVVSAGEPGDEKEFNDLARYIRRYDMAKPEHYAYVCERLDIDSLMDLWIARLYFNARDFPENNIKVWRNKDPNDPSGMDTKWHFVMLDMDMGLAFFPNRDANDTAERADFFGSFFNQGTVAGAIMANLLENPDFRDRFLGRFYEVLQTELNAEALSPLLEAFIEQRTPLMALQEGRWAEDGAKRKTFEGDLADMRRFVEQRDRYVMRYLKKHFRVTEDELARLAGKE